MEIVSVWQQALATTDACLAAGVAEFVVCGGARNAALLEAVSRAQQATSIRVWHHFEERSAGFFALGRTMATGRPCAVITTSGTAAAELLPAVVEAHYQARPLVAVTADRPARFRPTGAPQTIHQPGIFGIYAANGGFAEWAGCGPLHLNVEMEEELAPDGECPAWRIGDFQPRQGRPAVADLARWLRQDAFRGLAVMVGGLEPSEQEEVFHFCHALGAPVVADATSGLREALGRLSLPDGDRLLAGRKPGKILRLGDLPCGRLWRDLEDWPEIAVWSVCRNGLPGLARPSGLTCGPLDRVLQALGEVEAVGDALDLLTQQGPRQVWIDELLETWPDSEPALVRAVSAYAALGAGVYLGNSMPVREWNLFAQHRVPVTAVRANRGTNGIDGQISTWLGWSASDRDAWAVIGDLTTLYDLAAGGLLEQVETQGRRLVVINNQGGAIFSRLPRLQTMSAQAARWLLNSHKADLAGFAKLWGLEHARVATIDDFDSLPDTTAPLLVEIRPDPAQTTAFWRAWDRMGNHRFP